MSTTGGRLRSFFDGALGLKRLLIAGVPVIVLLALNAAYVVSAARLRDAEADLRRAYMAKAELQALVSDVSQAEGAVGSYLLTRDVSLVEPLDRARQLLSARQDRLNDLLSDADQLQDLRNELVGMSTAHVAVLDRIRDAIRAQQEVPLAMLTEGRREGQALQMTAARMLRRQDDMLAGQRAAAGVLQMVALGLAVAGALAGLVCGGIAAVALSSRAARPQANRATTGAAPSPAPAKMVGSVLIVDDDARIRELLHRWLAPHGLELREAVDARSALSAIVEYAPSVILCDVHMPGQDGLWLAERVRATAPNAAIVLATGDSGISPFDSLREGVVSYVLKPFRRDEVLAAVREGLRWSANRTGKSNPVLPQTSPVAS